MKTDSFDAALIAHAIGAPCVTAALCVPRSVGIARFGERLTDEQVCVLRMHNAADPEVSHGAKNDAEVAIALELMDDGWIRWKRIQWQDGTESDERFMALSAAGWAELGRRGLRFGGGPTS